MGYVKFLGIAVDIFTGFSCERFLGISADSRIPRKNSCEFPKIFRKFVTWVNNAIHMNKKLVSCLWWNIGTTKVSEPILFSFFLNQTYNRLEVFKEKFTYLKGVFAKNKRRYWLKSKMFEGDCYSYFYLLRVSTRRKLFKTTHTNSESCNFVLIIYLIFLYTRHLKRQLFVH